MIGPYEVCQSFEDIWLDQIPAHWKSVKIKNLFHERVEKGHPTEPLLAATQTMGVVPKSLYGTRTVTAEKDLHLLKFVCVGDFVISLRSFQGGIEYAYYQGIISPAYTIMVPTQSIYPPYFRYLAKSFHFLELLKLCVTGIREGQNIDYAKLKNSFIPLPPQEEQEQIVRYLDSKISRIHHLISLKKQEIALLQEMKQAVISHAVTKGLDPNAEMKDSGVEWIGEIPARWKVTTISQIYNIVLGKMLTPTPKRNSDTLENYLCSQNIQWTGINTSEMKQMWFSEFEKKQYRLQNGDVLVTEGGNVGVSCIFKGEVSPCYIQNSVHRVSAKNSNYINNMFLYYWMILAKTSGYLDKICNKATIAHYTKEKLSQTPIVYLQPTEQKEIISYLERICTFIDVLIQNENRFIDRLNEYKTRLISDVVTGKIDVRTILVADPLPEENFNPDEPEIEAEIPGDNE